MIRGILIAGNESSVLNAIETEAARRVDKYALAPISNRFSGTESRPAVGSVSRFLLDWNPGSPVSARALVLAAENRLEHIGEAILVCNPPQIRKGAADFSFTDVEMLINDHIKGWFFLVKELASVFKVRGEGTLSLVYHDVHEAADDEETPDILGYSALAVFRSLTRSLLASAFNEPFLSLGFTSSDAGDDAGFAAFIFKQLEEKNRRGNGKLHKYGKLGFLKK